MRNSWIQVSEEKTTEGVSWCPVPAYTRNVTIDTIVGTDMTTAMFAPRINSINRTWLRKIVRDSLYHIERVRCLILVPHFLFPVSANSVQKGNFPCEELDLFHSTQQFLEQFYPFIRPDHRLSTNRG